MRLPYRPPFTTGPMARAIAAHAVPGLEVAHHGAEHTRVVHAPGGPAVVRVVLDAAPGVVSCDVRAADPDDVPHVVGMVRGWLDLDADPAEVAAAFGADPVLAPLVAARPGLRILGSVDGFETAALAILGQQVSLAAARTFAGRLVAAFGTPAPEGMTAFPEPADLAAAGPEAIRAAVGVTGARARSLHGFAEAAAAGLDLGPGADRAATRSALLALPGIGPWTADYVALRALGDRDAFPSGDLVLRRALGGVTARGAALMAEAWRPWRAYAAIHLWTREVFS
ncbi:MAG: 3-methyladenine DNA glycosylase 2 [Thermoleophilia bacterium]|nr:3-methyladenine DNA glycosylase 2 [Thermoleophilia bacterium]